MKIKEHTKPQQKTSACIGSAVDVKWHTAKK